MSETNRQDDLAQLLRVAGARPELPSERARRIWAHVAPAWRRQARLARLRRNATAIALAATLAAGLAFVWQRGSGGAVVIAEAVRVSGAPALLLRSGATTPGQSLAAGLQVRTGDALTTGAGRAGLRLRTGASLRIDRESAVRFLSPTVVALDRGALYVDSDPTLPRSAGVEVQTPLGSIQEIGTQFEVRVEADTLRVRVREGRVRLLEGDSWHDAQPRDEMTLSADGRLERDLVPVHGPAWEWTLEIAPRVDLDGRTLEAFLDWVSRETGWEVALADAETSRLLPETRVHAPFGDVTPAEALPIVLSACELSHRLENGVLIVGPVDRPLSGGV